MFLGTATSRSFRFFPLGFSALALVVAACSGRSAGVDASQGPDGGSGVASPEGGAEPAADAGAARESDAGGPAADDGGDADPSPAECPNLTGTVAKPLLKSVGAGGGYIPLTPTLFDVELGRGYPLFDSGHMATGTVSYTPSKSSQGLDLTSRAQSVLVAGDIASTLLGYDPSIAANGIAYNATYGSSVGNGTTSIQPIAWANDVAVSMPAMLQYRLSFVAGKRTEGGHAVLRDARRGSDWGSDSFTQTEYVASATYARYAAFAVHVSFDSACKRDAYLALAGNDELTTLLPNDDTRGLSAYLVKAGAEVSVLTIALGPSSEVQQVLDATTCATNALGACQKLVKDLAAVVDAVDSPPSPATFQASPQGNGGWFVDHLMRENAQTLQP